MGRTEETRRLVRGEQTEYSESPLGGAKKKTNGGEGDFLKGEGLKQQKKRSEESKNANTGLVPLTEARQSSGSESRGRGMDARKRQPKRLRRARGKGTPQHAKLIEANGSCRLSEAQRKRQGVVGKLGNHDASGSPEPGVTELSTSTKK